MSLSPLEKAASGALALAIANTLVYPLDISKTLIQTQVVKTNEKGEKEALKYKNTSDCLSQLYKKKGILGWYQGLLLSIFGTAAQNFSYFYWYTIVKRVYANLHRHVPNHKPNTVTELFLGALAAAISQLFTMPIGVLTTQQQTDKQQKNLLQLAKDILDQDGISGLWRGLRVSLVLCINPLITYGLYERFKQILYGDKEYLRPLESFLLGVLAKLLATVATQPLIVSKALLQKKTYVKKGDQKDVKDVKETKEQDIKFDLFSEALKYLWKTEQFKGLYKGITPQLMKGVVVQGLLFMCKDQLDLLFLFLLRLARGGRRRAVLK